MNTSTSFTSSWLDGSPSRQSPSRNGRYTPRGSLVRDLKESPSRQAQVEFNLMLTRNDRDFHERLDKASAERARLHDEQLAKAAQEHLRIQEGAKLEMERLLLEQEQEQLKRAEVQRKEVERLRQEKAQQEAEAQRQRLEAKKKEEELARQSAEHQRQIQEADARVKAQREQEAAAQRQREAAAAKAKEDAAAAAVADAQARANAQRPSQPQPTSAPAPSAPRPVPAAIPAQSSASASSSAGVEELHRKYIELHARMKKFRTEFAESVKEKGHPLKNVVGEARRSLRLRLGQIGIDRKTTQAAIANIREECFNKALNTQGPTVDIRPYLITQQLDVQQEADAQYPAFLLYMWIMYQKCVIQSWISEADTQGGVALQEVGLITASLFADKRYMVKESVPLTDIILAKMHRRCPLLFGIRGNTTTAGGVFNLGLDKFRDDENVYARTITGVSAGYASLCLRHFKDKAPPFPMVSYWRAVVQVINTPSAQIYAGHYYAAKGLLRDFAHKFLLYYGMPAKAVLRRATKHFPGQAITDRPGVAIAADLVRVLSDSWKSDYKLVID